MKILITLTFLIFTVPFTAFAEGGSFFPEPQKVQTVQVQSSVLDQANSLTRQNLADFINLQALKRPYPPQMSAQVLGKGGEALLITAHSDSFIDTEYRARAAMVRFSSITRTLPVFVEMGISPYVDFPEMLNMMGFKALILSDGRDFSYQINISGQE